VGATRRKHSSDREELAPIVRAIETLTRRLDELERIATTNRKILDLQFRRMADIQAQLDHLVAHLKRAM